MKPNTNEMLGANRERKFQGQGQGPNWILIAGGALLSTLSIRLGYRLKQVLDSKHPQNTRNGLKENGKVTARKRAGNCHSQSHSNLYCFEQDDNETEIKPQLNGHQIHSDTQISLPLVTVSAPTYTKENGVMWASSPDRLELPKPFHHSNNSSDSPSVSESGSDIFSKREVIQKLRNQLKRRDDMILEMQDQIAELRNSLTSQHSHSGHLQSQLESANRELFDSATTNWNVVVNVRNDLDEPVLLTWNGIQHRRNSWQDGVLGTNCPIPAGWNWTYEFQVKDQIGSFFYFPSTNFQRAAGGYGGIIVNNRDVIPVPFGAPDGDITLVIGDWFIKSHKDLRKDVEKGVDLGSPDGVLINGLGPYRYDSTIVPDGIAYQVINVEPGKTYRFRVHNVGTSTSLNFRIQNHNLLLVETEGSYTIQQNYSNMDIHVGQSYSFLVTMDQTATTDYYIVATPRFLNSTKASGVAILHYSNSQGPASGPLPDLPNESDPSFSMTQARSIRTNVTAGAARPNPQGSFKYGEITVTDVFLLLNRPPELINGKRRTTLNGISFFSPSTPLKLAQQYNVLGIYKLDFPNKPMNRPPVIDTSIINATYKGFIEIILQNNDSTVQSYHLDGYAFYVVGMDYGVWTENSRSVYNKWDAVARSTTQVFPGAWTAIMVYLDNAGLWNLRAQNLDSWYLGQEVYLSVVNPEVTDPLPEDTIYCGVLSSLQKDQAQRVRFSSAPTVPMLYTRIFIALIITFIGIFMR